MTPKRCCFTCEEERLLARRSFWLYRCNEVVVSFGTASPTGDPQLEVSEFFGRHPELLGKRLALFMGRVHPKKGCDLLIEAFAKVLAEHSDWHLVIAGPDQVGWQEKLQYRAKQLGIDITDHLDRNGQWCHEMGSAASGRGVRSAFSSGELWRRSWLKP